MNPGAGLRWLDAGRVNRYLAAHAGEGSTTEPYELQHPLRLDDD